jgi:Flp pilus assembly protein TadD
VTDNPDAQYVLGSELYDRGQFDDAIAELHAFIARVGNDPASTYRTVAARNLVALSLAQQGKLAEAVEEFHVALRMDPRNPDLHGNLGFLLLQQNNFAGARQQYEEYLTVRAGNAFVLTSLGVALQKLGRIDDAKERFRQALVIDPNDVEARRRLDGASRP